MLSIEPTVSYTLCSMRPPAVNSWFFLHNVIPSHGGTNPHSETLGANRTDGRTSAAALTELQKLLDSVVSALRSTLQDAQAGIRLNCGMSVMARVSSRLA